MAGWRLERTYTELPQLFYVDALPSAVTEPRLVVFNSPLAKALGLDPEILNTADGARLFAGNVLPEGARPIAQAYAGHQFGHFTALGDGRAILLGEQITPSGERRDIQLKGPGQTKYSRRGDGRAALGPMLREYVMPFLRDRLHLGATPFFSGPAYGPSMLAAGVVLAIMALPYISAVSREVLMAVPRSQREAALALGATLWEMIRDAVVPYAKSGIVGGIMLGLGRALGETMAVTMVIGNRPEISASLFAPGYTMASLIANEFSEATNDLHLSALMAVGAILFVITLIVNAVARWLVWSVSRRRAQ